ncbi:MAG: mandelate racemase/muconate lactonizing enzyme family protein, partial [Rhodospirillaceae bacterium]|nr:mandelate racemase/muconate lactonizing enzyme family protein [Rhodospirillaceae bacterium]
MKITKVEAFALYLPVHIDVLDLDQTAGLSMCMVRIETDQGQVGWGITGITEEEVIAEVVNKVAGPAIIGLDPLAHEMIWNKLYWLLSPRGQSGYASHAIAAIDIALWDIKGKQYQAPVWDLLGGRCRDKIRLHLLGGAGTPEAMVTAAREAVAEGFTALKFDPVHHIDTGIDRMCRTAVELVAAAREGGGPDLDIIIEVHRKLTPMTALTLAEALAPFNLYFFEDPIQIDSIQTQSEVARRSNVPMGNGERLTTIWEFRELLEAGGPQYVRP